MMRLNFTGSAQIKASAGGLRRFAMDAYNGGPMRFAWSKVPVVVDIAGMDLGNKSRPILRDHDAQRIVGHSDRIIAAAGSLHVEGTASAVGPDALEVVAAADNGFPWQASIGCDIHDAEDVAHGQTATANGQTFAGPMMIVRSSRLGEISFVALGADDSTIARMIAARTQQTVHKENPMDLDTWIKSLGFDPSTITPEQSAALQKAYDAMPKEDAADAAKEDAMPENETEKAVAAATVNLQASRKQHADEARRVDAIATVCGTKHADIKAKAIEEGWSKDATELAVLKASRPTGPAIHVHGGESITGPVIEAAILQAARVPGLNETHDAKVLEAAHRRFKGRLGLQELLLEAAWANGYTGRSFRQDPRGVLRAAFDIQAAGFSNADISGILSNTANKCLLDGFMSVEHAWREISSVRPVSDFKTTTAYRLIGDDQYAEVGPGGDIEHGTLGELEYTNRAKTFAKMLSITRQDMINDDLGAMTTVPKKLGRGAALKLNSVFWTAYLDNSSFFTTGRGNAFVGATLSLLTIDGLTEAERLFRLQTDPEGQPLGLMPKVLLVPVALAAKGSALMTSTEIRDTTASTKAPVGNPFAGRFKLVSSAYMSNTSFTGASALAWYLLSDPADLAVIETVFLNGQESPTVETAEADFSTLGIQMRGYHDFGVSKQEYRAGVRAKGEA